LAKAGDGPDEREVQGEMGEQVYVEAEKVKESNKVL
jgi:hypothetical protein